MSDDTQVMDETWQTTSGLPLADARVEIVDFAFGYNPQIGGGLRLCANVRFRMLDSGDEIDQSFTTGENWEQVDKGAAAVKNGGTSKQKFSSQSNFGRLVDSVVSIGAGAALSARGKASEASTWIGTQWQTGTVKVDTKNPETGKEQTRDAIVFTGLLGSATNGDAKPAKTAKAAKATDAALDAELEAELLALAGESPDHDTFMEKALEKDAVASSREATNAVMASGKGSIWMRGNA